MLFFEERYEDPPEDPHVTVAEVEGYFLHGGMYLLQPGVDTPHDEGELPHGVADY